MPTPQKRYQLESAENSSEANGDMPLAQAKAQGQSSLLPFQAQAARRMKCAIDEATARASTPSTPLSLGLCLNRASSLVLNENHSRD
jgi:hypothetical protein